MTAGQEGLYGRHTSCYSTRLPGVRVPEVYTTLKSKPRGWFIRYDSATLTSSRFQKNQYSPRPLNLLLKRQESEQPSYYHYIFALKSTCGSSCAPGSPLGISETCLSGRTSATSTSRKCTGHFLISVWLSWLSHFNWNPRDPAAVAQ